MFKYIVMRRMNTPRQPNSFHTGPDERGHFGIYGGRYVAETLMPLILELEKAYTEAKSDPVFVMLVCIGTGSGCLSA